MNIFIVEDNINIIRLLEKIIIDRELGKLLGHATDGILGLKEIQRLTPDIVLVDLLMPGKDGISLVREVKRLYPEIQFIMISQVSSKDMIGKAYQSGIEYFISKPINAIEVESVINKVEDKIQVNRKLSQIQSLFTDPNSSSKNEKNFSKDNDEEDNYNGLNTEKENNSNRIEKIKRVMRVIGIAGETGSQDIISILEYLIRTKESIDSYTISELCSKFTHQAKTMEQRIRRTAMVGMINLANLGIEDYMNEIFIEYSNGIYNFEQIKIEMDYIRGKSRKRGKVNLKKIIDGLLFYSDSY
ncbi:two-component system response regulator YcbB [Clostridium punense]|uniref:Stage 0 sporulation protein A homolog n=1 Tax=Clostridium punense TaxID=1054297 RepID=A0ABS4JYI1_9CLOT|nr:two-component system response regulator YcbB [Clostridium punense]